MRIWGCAYLALSLSLARLSRTHYLCLDKFPIYALTNSRSILRRIPDVCYGRGHLTLRTFSHILSDERTQGVPLILETPAHDGKGKGKKGKGKGKGTGKCFACSGY